VSISGWSLLPSGRGTAEVEYNIQHNVERFEKGKVVTSSSLQDRLYRTEAIVLSRSDYGEADRIFSVFTPAKGKLRLIAKGVRRPTSRLGPHIEYFSRCQLMLARGRDLDVVTGAESVDPHLALRTNLDAYGHACHITELVNRLTEERQESLPLYDLLARSLRLLCDGVDPFAVARHFELVLLTILGYRPEFYMCAGCKGEIHETSNPLSPRLGGVLCEQCRTLDATARLLSINAQKYVRMLDRRGLADAVRLRPSPDLKLELEEAIGAYLRHVTERDLTSLKIWHQLRAHVPKEDAIVPTIGDNRAPAVAANKVD
jgi:DNA repair protein RecO (recombination protein O)